MPRLCAFANRSPCLAQGLCLMHVLHAMLQRKADAPSFVAQATLPGPGGACGRAGSRRGARRLQQ